jgi:hypothetical protein
MSEMASAQKTFLLMRRLVGVSLVIAMSTVSGLLSHPVANAQPTVTAEPGCTGEAPDGPEKTTGGTQDRDAVRELVVIDCTGQGLWAYVTVQFVRNNAKPWEARSGILKKWMKLDETLGGCNNCSGDAYTDPWVFGGSFNGTDKWGAIGEAKIFSNAQFAFGGPIFNAPPPSSLTPLQTFNIPGLETTF